MSKILYGAIGVILVIITALFLFIRGNAFITPESTPGPTPTVVTLPTPIVIEKISETNPSVSQNPNTSFACPSVDWINCMPGPNSPDKRCDKKYLDWAGINCPGFMGAAY